MGSSVQEMLDRALDKVAAGTDSRISLVSGYKRKLHDPIIKSLQYADSIVDKIPPPINLSSEKFVDNSYLRAFFHTTDGLKKVCSKSSELREFFQEPGHSHYPESCALLCMQKQEENILGMQLEGDRLMKDVMQTRVTFTNHRIQSPAADEGLARRGLKCCIFEGLVENALANISKLRARRRQLEAEQQMLGSRLRSLSGGAQSISNAGDIPLRSDSQPELESRLQQVARELDQLGYASPEASLELVSGILDCPEDFVSIKNISILLDKGGILKSDEKHQGSLSRLDLSEISIKGQAPRVVTLATVNREELFAPGIRFPQVI